MLADAAIELVASAGLRGLTHRGVDKAAGLPQGSTSYYARTRLALLELVIARILELDEVELDSPVADLDAAAALLAAFTHQASTAGRRRMIARYEFALEASRRPELRAAYDRAGLRLRRRAEALLAELGSTRPKRHARMLISWHDGVVFDSIAGTGSGKPPTRGELRDSARDLLRGMLGR